MTTLAPRLLLALALAVTAAGCVHVEPRSSTWNPLGWPARGITTVGFAAEDTEVAVVAEVGRLVSCVGRLLDAPALAVEGVLTFSDDLLFDAGRTLVVGTGETITAALNVPFSIFMGPRVDLGRDAALVNDALESLDEADLGATPRLVPWGTRVRASGRNLVWSVPGRGDVLQRAEVSWLFKAMTALPGGERFVAQERSWGFVVPGLARWDARPGPDRAVTIVHEMWHQHGQIEDQFLGWSLVYWPAYHGTYFFTGWDGHWAETGRGGAQKVDDALRFWRLDPRHGAGEDLDT